MKDEAETTSKRAKAKKAFTQEVEEKAVPKNAKKGLEVEVNVAKVREARSRAAKKESEVIVDEIAGSKHSVKLGKKEEEVEEVNVKPESRSKHDKVKHQEKGKSGGFLAGIVKSVKSSFAKKAVEKQKVGSKAEEEEAKSSASSQQHKHGGKSIKEEVPKVGKAHGKSIKENDERAAADSPKAGGKKRQPKAKRGMAKLGVDEHREEEEEPPSGLSIADVALAAARALPKQGDTKGQHQHGGAYPSLGADNKQRGGGTDFSLPGFVR